MSVIELRQYTLRPGRRDELIDLFDREFVDPQEEAGMSVLGQFRDLDDPDRFVWLRGFPDMTTRHRALTTFYDGPVWAKHGPAANATMLDSDNVLLLRPLTPLPTLPARPAPGTPPPGTCVSATIWPTPPGAPATEAPFLTLTTEPSTNTFTRLPVRTGENVTVTLTRYPGEATFERDHPRVQTTAQTLRLSPTGRSLIR
ncbi:hypothetical protein SRB5_38970 [Streptomyces sp. RB5]|uniref:NIPSNAP domain-containing protein n=1 Tax=Streptomyces smaragdinus TaxID=2585196 RepID=A0A7K0CJS7_9ACTN|nr:NIPSNAP family protein [Streptomyces smaragdinus]MQY13745.1 hypothetical protein [Streptomyces smaragdinus]